ncbi:response regulator transcription factor [Desnuesiella massiliensis]|uniref:response regulator transcription factor n=1 Tax=Desnuesiella massiliensis TaxID=1650662 RepID=UPI0006E44887|nr:response regulator [Desnuesiella massiliensis]
MYKILIVDDEINIRELLYQSLEELEEANVQIKMASNGKEALDIIYKEPPDLIYLDIMLPEINGYDICKQLKSDEKYNDIYIIMLTAKGQEFDKRKGIEVGADLYITKPFDPDFILNKTYKILNI